MQTLNERWESFREEGIDPEAGEDQLSEMKRAFFAGCAETLRACADACDGADQDEVEDRVEQLQEEVLAFGVSLEAEED